MLMLVSVEWIRNTERAEDRAPRISFRKPRARLWRRKINVLREGWRGSV
jgi:hypothetical protein